MSGREYLLAENIMTSAISPLFIGTKSPNYGWGLWSLGNQDNYVYIIDPVKFYSYLDEVGLLDIFIERYSDPGSFDKNDNWVDSILQESNDFKKMSVVAKKEVAKTISSGVIYHPGSVKNPFIRSGKGLVYLPGSSIKGAFRTAFIYGLLKKLKKAAPNDFRSLVVDNVNNKIREYQGARDRNRFKQTFDEKIIRAVLYPPGKILANYDLFRFVKISDGMIQSGRSETGKAIVLNIGNWHIGPKAGHSDRPISIPCEYLQQNVKIKFQVAIDLNIYSHIRKDLDDNKAIISSYLPDIDKVDDLLRVVSEFAEDQWWHEKDFTNSRLKGTKYNQLSEYYIDQSEDGQKPFLRIGWGTGMMGMTINMLFDKNPDGSGGLREKIRNISTLRGDEPAPKSRRLLDRNGIYFPFGWLKRLSTDLP